MRNIYIYNVTYCMQAKISRLLFVARHGCRMVFSDILLRGGGGWLCFCVILALLVLI